MDWLGFFLPRLNLRKQPAESLNAPDPSDLARLDELRARGSRLHLPHPVRGFVVFEGEEAARGTAEQLQKDGFRCAVRSAQDGSWVITAITRIVPTPGALTRLREQLESVSSAQGGVYRGWDAPVVY